MLITTTPPRKESVDPPQETRTTSAQSVEATEVTDDVASEFQTIQASQWDLSIARPELVLTGSPITGLGVYHM